MEGIAQSPVEPRKEGTMERGQSSRSEVPPSRIAAALLVWLFAR